MRNHKGVRHGRGGKIEVYDLTLDPAESRDLASEQPDLVKRLGAAMDQAHVPSPDWPQKQPARKAAKSPAK